jgi:amino acid adenylation domain-containing protein
MKALDEFMAELRQSGVKLWVEGDRLKLRAPGGAMTPALMADLKERKAEILASLQPEPLDPIEPVAPRDSYEPSPAQRRLWVLAQLAEGSAAYNIPLHQRVEGPLDRPALEAAFSGLVRRHESLRTTFVAVDGEPRQVVHPARDVPLAFRDLSDHPDPAGLARDLGRREAVRPFDLEAGPLLRAGLLKLAEDRHVLLLTIHHIIADGVSFGVLTRDLSCLYDSARTGRPDGLPALRIGYPAYAAWQNRLLQGEFLAVHGRYWRAKLSGELPVLDLPTDRPRPPVQTFRGDELTFTLAPERSGAFLGFCRERHASLFIGLLAALKVLLFAYTGQEDIIVGSPIAGRDHPDLQDQIGFYLNTLALRDRIRGEMPFEEVFEQVKWTATEAFDHQTYPFDRLVEELDVKRDLSRFPLFDVMLILQNQHEAPLTLGAARARPEFEHPGTSKFDLTFCFKETSQGLILALEYNTDLFREDRVRRMGGHFLTLIGRILADPSAPVRDLDLLTDGERDQLIRGFNETAAPYPRDRTAVDLLEAAAEREPDAVALSCGEEDLTYRQLHARANQLAWHLIALGVGPETPVGLCVERCPEMVIGLLGILKAGGAYVPLDPSFPRDRLALIVEDAGLPVIVTRGRLRDVLPPGSARIVDLDADRGRIERWPADPPPRGIGPGHLAYVIYTSGSTGRPKGVEIPHGALVNFLTAMARRPGLARRDVLLAVTTISFDIAGLELYLPLIRGARVVLAEDAAVADGRRLAELLARSRATAMQATPATWRLLLASGWPGDKRLKILCGGEALPRHLSAQLLERGGSVWNMYGPTEMTIWCAVREIGPADDRGRGDAVEPIGRPIANTQAYVLNAALRPVPLGVAGELCLAGDNLARGYRDQPGLTAERFVPDPFGPEPGRRLYRTGDLARFRPDGDLEFLARIDQQVKVRGFRIELEEIESVLLTHPRIREAVVAAREDGAGDKQLVAYFVGRGPGPVSVAELREHLRRTLPDYAVPSLFQRLPALPLTPNGKVDRRALPVPERDRPGQVTDCVAPRDELERRIAGLWREVLDVDRIGVHDSFFELGGHSLRAVKLIFKIQQALGVMLSLTDVFRAPTVAGLCRVIGERDGSGQAAAAPVDSPPPRDGDEGRIPEAIAPMTPEELELLN